MVAAPETPLPLDLARPKLDLPPPYTLVTLRERGDAFSHACRIAPENGAGTFVHVGRFDLLEFAVVLEPEEPLAFARRAFFAGMVALGDAIAAHCPPEKPLAFAWPDTIFFDGAVIGGARLGWPEGPEDAVPDWLVFGAQLTAARVGMSEAGLLPGSTSLEEEGFEESRAVAESFARHLMVAFDTWREKGFAPIAQEYLRRLTGGEGETRRIDPKGDLLVQDGKAAPVRRALVPALKEVAWFDAERGGPKL